MEAVGVKARSLGVKTRETAGVEPVAEAGVALFGVAPVGVVTVGVAPVWEPCKAEVGDDTPVIPKLLKAEVGVEEPAVLLAIESCEPNDGEVPPDEILPTGKLADPPLPGGAIKPAI